MSIFFRIEINQSLLSQLILQENHLPQSGSQYPRGIHDLGLDSSWRASQSAGS